MIEGYIKKIEESGDGIILEVYIKVPESPTQPDRSEFDIADEPRFINAEEIYQKRMGEWKEQVIGIRRLRIGVIEMKQYWYRGD